jgi:hypothetical protein
MRNTHITLLHKQAARSMDTGVFCLGDLEKLYGELCNGTYNIEGAETSNKCFRGFGRLRRVL